MWSIRLINIETIIHTKIEWDLCIPNDLQVASYKEIISDEDVYTEGEISLIGELE